MEKRSALLAIAVGLALGSPAAAQDSRPATSAASEGSPATTHLVLEVGLGRDTISRHIYGQFAEHLGRDIYDGVWTKAGGVPWHLRTDVIDALRRLRVPNVRWPGGCFADYCHWRDGIGPAARRPKMVNTIWGNVVEDNSFGTHEYFELVRRIGAEQAMVLTRGTRMILTPTYHVFEFYTVHQDALLLPMTVVDAGKYVFNGDSVPAVSATASRDAHGVVHLTMSNLDPNRERTAVVELHGVQATSATGRVPKSVIVLELR